MKHAWGYATDQRLRDENQDSHGVFHFDGFTLALVCDGMGGHVGGAEASAIAVRTIWETMTELQGRPVGSSLQRAIYAANEKIYEASRKHRRFMGMGTTVVALALEGNLAHIAHVGDSRLYAIRGGEAHLLTRDHTMVNLFVEAELLSAEDAAAHPEAHVLARSLGVEQTVEVDLQDPIELEPGDILLLCSDGVHGPIDDAMLGNVDWSDLPNGAEHVLDAVRRRDGDDNATIVVVGLDIPDAREVSPTPPPEPVDLERRAAEAGGDGEQIDAITPERTEPKPPMLYDEAQAQIAESQGRMQTVDGVSVQLEPLELDDVQMEPVEDVEIGVEGLQPVARPGAGTTSLSSMLSQAQDAARNRTALIAVAVVLVSLTCVGGVAVSRLLSGGSAEANGGQAQVEFLTPTPTPTQPVDTDALAEVADVDPMPAPDAAPRIDDTDHEIAFRFAPDKRRLKARYGHRPSRSWGPPPTGARLTSIQAAARDHQCMKSLSETMATMEISQDYGESYKNAWTCFDIAHYDPLTHGSLGIDSPEEFVTLLPHFEGELATSDRLYWFRPAASGLEYRIEAYLGSTSKDMLAESILDQYGEERIADVFGRDLLVEAEAAEALCRAESATVDVHQLCARRVYQVTRTLTATACCGGLPSPADLLDKHRPKLKQRIEQTMDNAVGGAITDRARAAGLHSTVAEALRVGLGEQSVPTVARPRPVVAAQPVAEPVAPEPVRPEDIRVHEFGPDDGLQDDGDGDSEHEAADGG